MGAYYNKFSNREKTNNSNKKNICCCCLFCGQPRVMGCPLFAHRRGAVGWVGWSTLGEGKSFRFFLSVVYFLFVLPLAFCHSRILLLCRLLFVVYCLHLMALWGKNAMSMALGTRHSAHGTWAISVSLLSTPEHLPLRGEKKLQIKMKMEKMRMVDEDDRVVVICPPKVVTVCVVLCCCGCGCCCCCFVLPCCILRVLRIM